jgi:flavodoxin
MKKKILLICQSVHQGNTLKVAKEIAKELNADLKNPSEINFKDLKKYEFIGFGSGIYNGKHHQSLFNLLKDIEKQDNKKTFIFSTASIKYKKMHKSLRTELLSKGYIILDEFICKGYNNYSFLKYIGGINKNRPNEKDLKKAREFAIKIKEKINNSNL